MLTRSITYAGAVGLGTAALLAIINNFVDKAVTAFPSWLDFLALPDVRAFYPVIAATIVAYFVKDRPDEIAEQAVMQDAGYEVKTLITTKQKESDQ